MKTASFTLSELSQRQQESGQAWHPFFNVPGLSMGIYHLALGSDDRDSHDPHEQDEVYVVASGKGKLTVDGEPVSVQTGSVVYVKAGVTHHFHDVVEDVTVLVFFAGE